MAQQLLTEGLQADLVVGNNVLAHVPKLNDFVRGLKLLLRPQGVITLEFPHLLCLMAKTNSIRSITNTSPISPSAPWSRSSPSTA